MYKDTIQLQLNIHSTAQKFAFIACFMIFFAGILPAQQLPLFTQYREHSSSINPAAINSGYFNFEQNGVFGISYRSQWAGFASAPRTTVLHGSYFADDLSSVNLLVGGHLINDQIGPTGFTGLYGRIAGVLSDNPTFGGISFGLSVGAVQYRIKASELRVRDQDDLSISQDQSQMYPDVGLGIFAYKMLEGGALDGDYVYGGLSVPQVIGLDFAFTDETGSEFLTKRIQHMYAQVGFIKYFRDDSFIEPSVWVKYVPGAPVNVDANIRYQFVDAIWIGAGGSTSKTAHLEAGVLLGDNVGYENNLQIGYGYDYSFSSFGPFVGGSHEINLAYYFTR